MTYIFNTQANSYFRGQDLRVEDTDTHNVILVNVKDGMWAVNVKDDTLPREYPLEVRTALEALGENTSDRLYEEGKEDFWRTADDLAQERGFERSYTAGRSSGWMAVAGTEGWEPESIFDWEKDPQVKSFLSLAFATVGAIEGARSYYCEQVKEAMEELQIELSEYADWVGAEIRSLDGAVGEVYKLDVRQGRPALVMAGGLFSFTSEATLVRRANGQVPSRLTADPIMEQVFQIIESREDFTREQIDAFLEDEEGNEPARLYEDHFAPAISDLEHRIKEALQ